MDFSVEVRVLSGVFLLYFMNSLLEYISQYVDLHQKGGSHWAKCPFHDEKTPSFNVSNNKYYCFGCKVGGGIISFIMNYHGLSYREAMLIVNEKNISYSSTSNVMEELHKWFKLSLSYIEIDYLNKRGIDIEDIYRFGIGYVSGSIFRYLSSLNYSVEDILSTGLVLQKEGQFFNLFDNRIVFPIYNNNILVSFSGRTLNNDKPKYINGSETKIFRKHDTLHGYIFNKSKYTLIVEGYTDVISIAKKGINVFATMGTFSLKQLQRVWSIDTCPIICLDGDEAGKKACLRIIDFALPYISKSKSLKIATINDDPDYMINHGMEREFIYSINNASTIEDYLSLLNQSDLETIKNKRNNKSQSLSLSQSRIVDQSLREKIIISLLNKYPEVIEECSEDLSKITFTKHYQSLIEKIKNSEEIDIHFNMNNITREEAIEMISDIVKTTMLLEHKKCITDAFKKDFSEQSWKRLIDSFKK